MDFISSAIKRVIPTGIETVDGKSEELDIIICATGEKPIFLTIELMVELLEPRL